MWSNSSLPNARTIDAGNGIGLSTATSGKLIVSVERQKTTYLVTGSHGDGETLTVVNADFRSGSFMEKSIDIYVNGSLLSSGSSADYTLAGTANGVVFRFPLSSGDIITSVVT